MEIKKTLILDSSEPVSKALPHLDEFPAVIITKNGKYYGIIDHRSVSSAIKDPNNTKCETVVVRPPTMLEPATALDLIDGFLLGHFKALPVLSENEVPLGVTTRIELLKEMDRTRLIPNGNVTELMNSPVFTISENEKIGAVKSQLKEKNARRLVVTRNNVPVGMISSFDIGLWKGRTNLSNGRKDIHSGDVSIDEMSIRGILRPDVVLVEDNSTIGAAVKKMMQKEVSGVIVTSGKNAVGVLSALDIFKKIQDVVRNKIEINISGLGQDHMDQYDNITDKIGGLVEKFGKTFSIKNCSVHIKEEKSTFIVNVNFDTADEQISLKEEKSTLREAIDEIVLELDSILRRKKDKKKGRHRPNSRRRQDE